MFGVRGNKLYIFISAQKKKTEKTGKRNEKKLGTGKRLCSIKNVRKQKRRRKRRRKKLPSRFARP